jgi:hypothetical protein
VGSNFSVTLQTGRSNFGTGAIKFEDTLDIIGDTTSGNVAVATSNDDFATFSTPRNLDMSVEVKRLTRLGSFYSRAHRFTYTANDAFRVQAFLPGIRIGLS